MNVVRGDCIAMLCDALLAKSKLRTPIIMDVDHGFCDSLLSLETNVDIDVRAKELVVPIVLLRTIDARLKEAFGAQSPLMLVNLYKYLVVRKLFSTPVRAFNTNDTVNRIVALTDLSTGGDCGGGGSVERQARFQSNLMCAIDWAFVSQLIRHTDCAFIITNPHDDKRIVYKPAYLERKRFVIFAYNNDDLTMLVKSWT